MPAGIQMSLLFKVISLVKEVGDAFMRSEISPSK